MILGITPYNFPINLLVHKIAPAIATGNSILIKPSPCTPATAEKLCELFEARIPGLVQVVLTNDDTAARLTQARPVAMVTFTGSARVGHLIQSQCPGKPCTLELGGNAWCIVQKDTPDELFETIARRITLAAYSYAGQSCISVQNVAVHNTLWPRFKTALANATRKTGFGNPDSQEVLCGPVIQTSAAEHIRSQLSKVMPGSERVESETPHDPRGCANLITPTFIALHGGMKDAANTSTLVEEEIFGPVLIGRSFDNDAELIQKINSGRYGLQAGLYTQDLQSIERFYEELHVGGLVINDVPSTRYDHQPYGGVKESGSGREGPRYAMEEMTESKFLALSTQVI